MLTQVTTCHGNSEVVLSNLPRWLMSGIDQLVLVDYACPQKVSKTLLSKPISRNGKLTLIQVSSQEAGPFYNEGRAKNIGAKAAKGEYVLFLDARATLRSDFIDEVKLQLEGQESTDTEAGGDIAPVCPSMFVCKEAVQFINQDGYKEAAKHSKAIQSGEPLKFNQLIIRNSVLYNLNGFNEANLVPGLEVVDFLCRAYKEETPYATTTEYGYTMDEAISFRFNTPSPDVATSSIKDVLLNRELDKNVEALDLYSIMREMSTRAQPGRRFGISEHNKHVKMHVGGFERVFNPGLD